MKKILSLLTVVAFIATGGVAFADGHGSGSGSKGHKRMEQKFNQLPAEKQALVKEAMEALKANMEEHRKATQALREDMKKLLEAENFDADAYREKVAEMQSLNTAAGAERVDAFVKLAEKLTPEERKIVKRMLNGSKKGGKKGKWGKRGHGK